MTVNMLVAQLTKKKQIQAEVINQLKEPIWYAKTLTE